MNYEEGSALFINLSAACTPLTPSNAALFAQMIKFIETFSCFLFEVEADQFYYDFF